MCKHRLRQGDPLSSFPFILEVDVQSKAFKNATAAGFMQRVEYYNNQPDFFYVQYADDTLFETLTDERSLRNDKILPVCYEMLAGLQVNLDKIFIYKLGPTTEENLMRVASRFGCKIGEYPFSYLGIPLKQTSLSRTDWLPMIDRVE